MSIATQIQSLEPGALFVGYELDGTAIGAGVLRFHAHLQSGPVFWQGLEYAPYPVKAEGFALSTDKPPQPKLTVANLDRLVTTLCAHFEDMVGARVTRRRTLVRFLDAVNFPGGNVSADPGEHLPDEVWFVERKSAETVEAVEFELSSAMDFNGIRLPRRPIIANQCTFAYRGPDCGYAGGPVAQADGTPTSDPLLDRCGKRLSDCKRRFGDNNPLNYGGFPACGLART